MRFEDLANAVLAAQTEPNQQKQILSELFTRNKESAHDIVTICCSNPRLSIKPHHIVKMLAQSYGLFPEEYESLMDEHEMPSLLASESPNEIETSLSLREVIEIKDMIFKGEMNADIVFQSMSRISAMLFWGFCFGRTSLNYRRVMRAIAHVTPYETNHLQTMRTIMPSGDVIQRALNNTLPSEYNIEPTYPFKAPTYSRWNRWSIPFTNTHYEIVRGKNYFVHRRAGRLFSFDRHAVRIVRTPLIEGDDDVVCEMDESGNIVEWLYREGEPNVWKSNRKARATNPKEVKDRAHLRAIVQSLEEGEVLRLIDAERPYFHSGGVGGFIVPRRTFDIPLLILGGYRDGDGIRIKIAALDGFEPFPVGYAFVKADDIPDKLVRLYDAQSMLDIDEGLIGIFHSLGYVHEEGKMRAPYLARIDTTLGHSDAIQLGDLLERGEPNG
jgi:hypothetical protein